MRRLRFFLILGGGLSLLCGVALWLLWTHCGLEGCPDLRGLTEYVPDQASVVIDREGGELGQLYRVNRVVVPLDSLPPYLPAAFIAVEDQRFWRHNGVDWYRVLGAAWANLRARRVEEGFSTITMQLARNVFPEELPQTDRTLRRKWTEMRVAGEIERNFSKEEILELYLNQIYFGEGAWGVEAAALEYFGKPASELTLGEAAILAGLIRAPQRLNPRRNLEAARRRRGVVLSKMVEQDFITLADANLAAAEEIEVEERKIEEGEGTAAYFLEEEGQEDERILGGGARRPPPRCSRRCVRRSRVSSVVVPTPVAISSIRPSIREPRGPPRKSSRPRSPLSRGDVTGTSDTRTVAQRRGDEQAPIPRSHPISRAQSSSSM